MCLRNSPAVVVAEARGARHGSSAVGSVCPPITSPPPVSVCALLSGLYILSVGLDAVTLCVTAGVYGCAHKQRCECSQTADVLNMF